LKNKEKIRQIYEALPKLNCGLCGFGNCGQFARAVAEGKASPFGCRQNPWSGYKVSEIMGIKLPAYSYALQSTFIPTPRVTPSPESIREEIQELSQEVANILARIENFKKKDKTRL
jgi:Na+-translocating ferredoxin:NAD+ oxidoreductase RNF subunit RnfB